MSSGPISNADTDGGNNIMLTRLETQTPELETEFLFQMRVKRAAPVGKGRVGDGGVIYDVFAVK